MIEHETFESESSQLTISYELLCLLRWLVENDMDKLKKIVTKALTSGLKEELKQDREYAYHRSHDDIQHSIIDFFGILEGLLAESMNELAVKKALEKNLMPAIDQIDSSVCDDATVRFSIEKATSKIEHNPHENPKELLFRELLKRWKPSKKKIMN